MNPKFSWEENRFDTEILGFNCAKIFNNDEGKFELKELVTDLRKNKIQYAIIRIPSQNYEVAQFLEANNFRIVDSLVELSLSLGIVDREKVEHIREATSADGVIIVKIALDAFSDTRFFHDPLISKDSARKIYSEWVKNSVSGIAADRVLVYENKGEIFGFATIQKNGHIPLIAVRIDQQGKGVGRALCNAAVIVSKEFGATNAAIETQTNNIAALRAYLNSGFKINNSYFTFRWHDKS